MNTATETVLDATDTIRTPKAAHRFAREAFRANEKLQVVLVRMLWSFRNGRRRIEWIEIVPGGGERIFRRLACTA